MTFQFISDTVIFLLTCVKQLIIIINYQLLNYVVNRLCSVWRSLFTNVYKCDIIMTSSPAMNI